MPAWSRSSDPVAWARHGWRWTSRAPAPRPTPAARSSSRLARVADAAGVASTIAATLDLRPPPGGELAALSDLGSVDALLVLDNCEHVIDAVVSVASPMLAAGDRLRLLATSREPLAIAGEHVLPLHPLATDGSDAPAIEMFRQRAIAAAPTGTLDDELIADVVVTARRAAAGAGDGCSPPAHDDAGRGGELDRRRPRRAGLAAP